MTVLNDLTTRENPQVSQPSVVSAADTDTAVTPDMKAGAVARLDVALENIKAGIANDVAFNDDNGKPLLRADDSRKLGAVVESYIAQRREQQSTNAAPTFHCNVEERLRKLTKLHDAIVDLQSPHLGMSVELALEGIAHDAYNHRGSVKLVDALANIFHEFEDDRRSLVVPIQNPKERWNEFIGEVEASLYERFEIKPPQIIKPMVRSAEAYKSDISQLVTKVLNSVGVAAPQAQGRGA